MFSGSKIIFSLAAAVLLVAGFPGAAHTDPRNPAPSDDRLISLYVYNFLLFVDWPPSVSKDGHTIKIVVLGRGAQSNFLDHLKGKNIRRNKLVIDHVDDLDQLDAGCHVLFVREGGMRGAPAALEKLRGQPCLTMSDVPKFTDIGGMVAFMNTAGEDGEPSEDGLKPVSKRFRIRLAAVHEAGLKIRSRLLRLSEIVGHVPRGTRTITSAQP